MIGHSASEARSLRFVTHKLDYAGHWFLFHNFISIYRVRQYMLNTFSNFSDKREKLVGKNI
jgi:hypothetical protein